MADDIAGQQFMMNTLRNGGLGGGGGGHHGGGGFPLASKIGGVSTEGTVLPGLDQAELKIQPAALLTMKKFADGMLGQIEAFKIPSLTKSIEPPPPTPPIPTGVMKGLVSPSRGGKG